MYAHFDPTVSSTPNVRIMEIDTPREQNINVQDTEQEITSVHSIKVLRESHLQPSLNEALPNPTSQSDESSQSENQGENLSSILDDDSLHEKIKEIKRINKEKAESQYDKLKEALTNLRKEKQQGTDVKEFGADVSAKNILNDRRNLMKAKRKAAHGK
jgi:hypothetical protein